MLGRAVILAAGTFLLTGAATAQTTDTEQARAKPIAKAPVEREPRVAPAEPDPLTPPEVQGPPPSAPVRAPPRRCCTPRPTRRRSWKGFEKP